MRMFRSNVTGMYFFLLDEVKIHNKCPLLDFKVENNTVQPLGKTMVDCDLNINSSNMIDELPVNFDFVQKYFISFWMRQNSDYLQNK